MSAYHSHFLWLQASGLWDEGSADEVSSAATGDGLSLRHFGCLELARAFQSFFAGVFTTAGAKISQPICGYCGRERDTTEIPRVLPGPAPPPQARPPKRCRELRARRLQATTKVSKLTPRDNACCPLTVLSLCSRGLLLVFNGGH